MTKYPNIENMSRALLEEKVSIDTILPLVKEMRGMSPEQKEQKASEIMALVETGKI